MRIMRLFAFAALLAACLCGCGKGQKEEIDVFNSFVTETSDSYEEHIGVVADTEAMRQSDYEQVALDIIEKYLANDFDSVLFSFDVRGYPYRLTATVYLTDGDVESGEPKFSMSYTADSREHDINGCGEDCELEITVD